MKRAIREINLLEKRIVKADDDADTMLWEQARQVVEQLEAGITDRELAKEWINGRTGKPYSRGHVYFTRMTFGQLAGQIPRPRFRDAYQAIAHAKPPKKPPEPEPFHWMTAVGDLVETVEQMIQAWPESVRDRAPRALRNLANTLEAELGGDRNARRGSRIEIARSSRDFVVEDGVPRAS